MDTSILVIFVRVLRPIKVKEKTQAKLRTLNLDWFPLKSNTSCCHLSVLAGFSEFWIAVVLILPERSCQGHVNFRSFWLWTKSHQLVKPLINRISSGRTQIAGEKIQKHTHALCAVHWSRHVLPYQLPGFLCSFAMKAKRLIHVIRMHISMNIWAHFIMRLIWRTLCVAIFWLICGETITEAGGLVTVNIFHAIDRSPDSKSLWRMWLMLTRRKITWPNKGTGNQVLCSLAEPFNHTRNQNRKKAELQWISDWTCWGDKGTLSRSYSQSLACFRVFQSRTWLMSRLQPSHSHSQPNSVCQSSRQAFCFSSHHVWSCFCIWILRFGRGVSLFFKTDRKAETRFSVRYHLALCSLVM